MENCPSGKSNCVGHFPPNLVQEVLTQTFSTISPEELRNLPAWHWWADWGPSVILRVSESEQPSSWPSSSRLTLLQVRWILAALCLNKSWCGLQSSGLTSRTGSWLTEPRPRNIWTRLGWNSFPWREETLHWDLGVLSSTTAPLRLARSIWSSMKSSWERIL